MSPVKERPILFKGEMVRAILAGTKTQTRRVVKWHNVAAGLNLQFSGLAAREYPGGWILEAPTRTSTEDRCWPTPCPFGAPGDRLWVRESWAYNPDCPGVAARACFMADPEHKHDGLKWKPSIHMPRAVCRITLEVTGVRVERLSDISYEDAVAEGISDPASCPAFPQPSNETAAEYARRTQYPQRAYRALWEEINGPGSWEANPWVWVVEFRRIEP